MARNTKKGSPNRSGKGKPAKSMPLAKGKVARKATRKAPKPVKQAKAAKPVSRGKAAAKKASPKRKVAAKPVHDAAHEHHMAEIRQQVARRRPGMAPMVTHGHEQQDPSIIAPPAPPPAPVDSLHQNWGDAKERSVTRNDKPTNWFRQAPKPKSK